MTEEDADRQPSFLAQSAASSHSRPSEQQPASNVSSTPLASATPAQLEEGIRELREIFAQARVTPHWPMYLRNVKQYVKNAAPTFDERRYGFASFLEVIRSGQRAGLFRLERNRQGILRIFPGNQFPPQAQTRPTAIEETEEVQTAPEEQAAAEAQMPLPEAEPVLETIAAVEEVDTPALETTAAGEEQPAATEPAERHPPRARRTRAAAATAATPANAKKKPRPRSTTPRRTTKKKPDTEAGTE